MMWYDMKGSAKITLLLLALTLITGPGIAKVLGASNLSVTLSVASASVSWLIILLARNWQILSLSVLFASFFVAYTFGPTLEGVFAEGGDLESRGHGVASILLSGKQVPFDVIAILAGSGLFAFTIGVLGGTIRNSSSAFPTLGNSYGKVWHVLGISAILLGFGMSLLDTGRAGGVQAMLIPRVERLYVLAESRGGLPYAALIFSGFVVAIAGWLGARRGRKRTWPLLLGVLISAWVFYLLLQGDRRFILYTLLVFVGVLSVFYRVLVRLTARVVLVLIVLYFIMSLFGATRWMIAPILQGSMSLGESISWVLDNVSGAWFLPSAGEFMGPYVTLVITLTDPDWWLEAKAPLMGASYLYAVPNLLPRSLYPGEKWETLSFRFANYMFSKYLPPEYTLPIGWGFSPLAEACLNFGISPLAPIPVFLLLGWFFGRLEGLAQRRSLSWGIVYVLVLPQAFNVNRIDLAWSFQEAIYYVGTGLVLVTFAHSIDKILTLKRMRNTVRRL